VDLKHWEVVVQKDTLKYAALKETKLTHYHLHPGPFQKMTVSWAWQVRSNIVTIKPLLIKTLQAMINSLFAHSFGAHQWQQLCIPTNYKERQSLPTATNLPGLQ